MRVSVKVAQGSWSCLQYSPKEFKGTDGVKCVQFLEAQNLLFADHLVLIGWLSSALDIRWGAQTSGRSLEQSCCSFVLKGTSVGVPRIWLGCLLGAYLLRLSGHAQFREYPRVAPEELQISFGLGMPHDPPGGTKMWLGRGTSKNSLLSLLPPWPDPR